MTSIERQMAEDRAVRDAALRLFKADLDLVRSDLAARGAGQRVADRVSDAALDTVDDAVDYAQDNKGPVAAGIAALLLFLFRGPLFDALASLLGDHDEGDGEEDWR